MKNLAAIITLAALLFVFVFTGCANFQQVDPSQIFTPISSDTYKNQVSPLIQVVSVIYGQKLTPQQQQAIAARGNVLVMAGAGMCNAGRILHHLKANLWKPETHVVIVGYQGDGSLGRRLEVDSAHLARLPDLAAGSIRRTGGGDEVDGLPDDQACRCDLLDPDRDLKGVA